MKITKKLLLANIIVLTTLIIVPKIVPELQSANSVEAASIIKLNKKSQTIYEGNTYTLKVMGTKQKVKWSSSNKKVPTVNSKGIVTAKKNGTATITAKVGTKKLTCKVKVRLLQFNETFYSLEDASKAYIKVSKIKNSKTYKYDLDGDKKKDTIKIIKTDFEGSFFYSVQLNGSEFAQLPSDRTIYFVDLNGNNKTIQVVIKEDEETRSYEILSKKGSEMKELKTLYGFNGKAQIRINKKGKG